MGEIRAGSSHVDITPDEPVPLSGYPTNIESPAFRDGPRPELSTDVRDPIGVRTLVLSDDDRTVAIVAADLANVYREFSEEIRAATADLGIDEIVFTATHTHSAPYMPGLLLEINPFLAFETDVSPVVDRIRAAFVESIRSAHDAQEPATIRVGRATNDVTAVNRRVDDGPIDPELIALHVIGESGQETTLLNYACHPVCLSGNTAVVSADYVGTVYEQVREETDDGVTLFVNGAAGDINPRDVGNRYDDESAYTDEIGAEIAETALDAVSNARSSEPLTGPIRAERRDLDLELRSVADTESLRSQIRDLDEEIAQLEANGDEDALFDRRWDRIYAQERFNVAELDAETVPATVHYLGVGEFGVVTFPGEAFVEHGLDLKARRGDHPLAIAGFANEYAGYLPTLDEFERSGYEVRTCKITAEAVESIRTAAFDILPETEN